MDYTSIQEANRITIHIALGNAAMLTYDDVAGALNGLADSFREYGDARAVYSNGLFVVRDLNGNVVGHVVAE